MRRPPRATRTDTLFPYTTLFRSGLDFDRLVPMTACLIGGSTCDMVLRDRPGPVRLALDAHARPPHRLEPPHMGFGKRLRSRGIVPQVKIDRIDRKSTRLNSSH